MGIEIKHNEGKKPGFVAKFKRGAAKLGENIKSGVKNINETLDKKEAEQLERRKKQIQQLKVEGQYLKEKQKVQKLRAPTAGSIGLGGGSFGAFAPIKPAPVRSEPKPKKKYVIKGGKAYPIAGSSKPKTKPTHGDDDIFNNFNGFF